MISRISHMKKIVACLLLTVTLFAACSDEDGVTEPIDTPAIVATPDPFDVNILSAVVLQPSDVAPPLVSRGGAAGAAVSTYTASYGDPSLRIQSTVMRVVDPVQRDQELLQMRRLFAGVAGFEATLELEGADQSFSYARFNFNENREVVLISKGDLLSFVDIGSNEQANSGIVHDLDALTEYASKILLRMEQAGSDPPAIAPIPGEPTFGIPTVGNAPAE
jgi:hypothetical protein